MVYYQMVMLLPKFFTSENNISGSCILIENGDARHISGVLRMKKGESVVISDGHGTDYFCRIDTLGDTVRAKIISHAPSEGEPAVDVSLYIALQKGDKLEYVVQKSVELGAHKIVLFYSSRCVSRPDAQTLEKKVARLQRIAREAAGQCGRGIIPQVCSVASFEEAVLLAAKHELGLFLYEGGSGKTLAQVLIQGYTDCSFMVGPEGGFSPQEHDLAMRAGLADTTLGKRILRCETVPLCVLSALMYQAGEL